MSKGLSGYYKLQIDQLNVKIHDKNENLKRLEAQRNDLNARGMFYSTFNLFLHCYESCLIM